MPIVKTEFWERQPDGTGILVKVEEVEVPEVDLIKQKEEQLLEIYAELQALKNNQQNNAS